MGNKILVVDDEVAIRTLLDDILSSEGYRVTEAVDGNNAIEEIEKDVPDLLITDLQMPKMDGMMLAAEIRNLGSTIPLMLLSSIRQQEMERETSDFVAFLLKPIKASQLYNVVVGIFAEEERPRERRADADKPQFDPEMGERLPLRILLAEDNTVNQKLALHLLERMGYRADLAANGLEVMEALRRQPYDTILMDVQMPEMDGLDATRRIRQELDTDKQPRIIAMTASAMKEDRDACQAAGMDDYISKPIRVEELVKALRKCRPLA